MIATHHAATIAQTGKGQEHHAIAGLGSDILEIR